MAPQVCHVPAEAAKIFQRLRPVASPVRFAPFIVTVVEGIPLRHQVEVSGVKVIHVFQVLRRLGLCDYRDTLADFLQDGFAFGKGGVKRILKGG